MGHSISAAINGGREQLTLKFSTNPRPARFGAGCFGCQVRKKAIVTTIRTYPKSDTYVSCAICSWEVPLAGSSRRAKEFSVACPNCGRRHLYGSADAHDSRVAGGGKTSRMLEFSTKPKIAEKKLEENEPAPRSWLKECTSWLLQ